jgi:hypothetical protein
MVSTCPSLQKLSTRFFSCTDSKWQPSLALSSLSVTKAWYAVFLFSLIPFHFLRALVGSKSHFRVSERTGERSAGLADEKSAALGRTIVQ